MMKNDVKKCHVKNDKVERVLLYHFFKMMKILLKMCLLGRKIVPELQNRVTHYDVTNRVTNFSNW